MTAYDRELWDAIVYDAYDRPTPDPMSSGMKGLPLGERRTLVIDDRTVPTIEICIQSSDESYTGERLSAYADEAWWERNILRFTNLDWRGSIDIASCSDDPGNGWVNVREGTLEEFDKFSDRTLAFASSWRTDDAHGVWGGDGNWYRSQIVWHPDKVHETTDAFFEKTLAHELGHVLGFLHAPPGSGFAMVSGEQTTWPDKERYLAQWAYYIGPNVPYPGFVRPTATTPGDLEGGVKDLVDEALDELNDDSNGRQATESVPALPAAGVLLLAILLGLLGRRRLRAG